MTALVLLLVGGLHEVWIFAVWPFASRADFTRVVGGVDEDEAPPAWSTAAVAVLLLAAAYLVAGRAGIVGEIGPPWLHTVGAWGVTAVLLVRGVVGLTVFSRRRDIFGRMDRKVYSPLCVALATGSAVVALS
ncbi:DUF3995 domain-containing protein [Amycolatopsis cihanbeyliensis]|nr:DUF3995 domain-containing protein [Amycolatopsis cihanbeyliensis]